MGNRYHYDRHGNYRGMTSDEPPGTDNSGCVFAVVVIVLICIFSGGC